jgi:hypothetical protein
MLWTDNTIPPRRSPFNSKFYKINLAIAFLGGINCDVYLTSGCRVMVNTKYPFCSIYYNQIYYTVAPKKPVLNPLLGSFILVGKQVKASHL